MNLKNYLASLCISISDFSRNCGLPYSTIAELISGKKTLLKCNASTVYVIAKDLGISVEELLEKDCNIKNIFEEKLISVLIDGEFILQKRDLMLKLRGSSNQRIIRLNEK